jgi:alkylation response protein AidB-like acyl-CoA dehydrogenase
MEGQRQTVFNATHMVEAVQALAPQIRAAIDSMDADRCLPPALVQAMKKTGLFRASLPRAYEGLELDPLTQIQVVEELSRLDGSVGWCGGFGALSGIVCAFLAPATVQQLYGDPDTVTAGQYAPMGQAEQVKDGYRVSGRWGFGSGCRHAEMMMAGCTIVENGAPRRLANGQPEIRIMLFPTTSCTILLDTWDTTGLRGTGSHDYTVQNLFVPVEHSFSFFDPPRCEGPLYTLPNLFLFGHASFPLGIARGAIDTVVELSAQKLMWPSGRLLREEGQVQEAVAQAEAALGAARSYVFSVLGDLWETLCRGSTPSPRQRALFRIALIYVHRVAKEVVSSMYDAAATSAIHRSNPLDRQMRDILAVCQHRVVQAKMYRPGGRLLLGLDPNDPLF